MVRIASRSVSANTTVSSHFPTGEPSEISEVTYEPGWITPKLPLVCPDAIQVLLFLLTCLTTTFAGVQASPAFYAKYANVDITWTLLLLPENLIYGIPFSGTLLLILGVHEMGHFIAARHWNVRATLPYFIPFPTIIGTMGAIIRIKSRIPNRRALFDIGVSGPLAGFLIAVVALAYGFSNAEIVQMTRFEGGGGLIFGDSLLTSSLQYLIVGEIPADHDLMLGPVGFAGWLGLFVTVLNLLPVGQFDGGHLVYALYGKHHARISKITIGVLFGVWALGPEYGWIHDPSLFGTWLGSRWPGWLIWGFISIFLGRHHPPTLDPYTTLDSPRTRVGYLTIAIFIVCFIPNPIRWAGP
jgi:membrane-associated protease RseP (regulator of RpoE activity)